MADKERGWLAESVLIIISILVAFWIDAWWQEREDLENEKRVLLSLRAELQANVDELPSYIDAHKHSAQVGGEILQALADAGKGNSIVINDSRLFRLISSNSTDPQRGALDAVMQSGDLRYITNPAVREKIVGWPRLVIDATENEEMLRRIHGPALSRKLSQVSDLSPMLAMTGECFEDFSKAVCELEDIVIPFDTELLGLMWPVVGFENEAAVELAELRRETQKLIELLDAELAAFEE